MVWTAGQAVPSMRLSTGSLMPMLAFGTGAMPKGANSRRRLGRTTRAIVAVRVNQSLSLGFTHIDTSEVYPGFDAVGEAVLRSLPRERAFVTSKVDPTRAPGRRGSFCRADGSGCAEAMVLAANSTVQRLGFAPDLLLLHRPPHRHGDASAQCVRLRALWRGLETARRQGLARAIGLSNCCAQLLQCVATGTVREPPAVVQYMHHVGMGSDPFGYRTWAWRTWKAVYMAYSVLGGAEGDFKRIAHGPVVERIASAHATAGANVALSWVAQQQMPLVVLSDSAAHLREDLHLFRQPAWAPLTDTEMAELSALQEPGGRPSHWGDCADTAITN